MPPPLVIAHRGDSHNALENSLQAMRLALVEGVDMIEVDVRLSSDKQLYIMHDRRTGRTAAHDIDIERSKASTIDTIKLKNGENIPSLSALFEHVSGKCGLNLEIKSPGAGALTAHYILSSGYQGHVILSSFKEEEVLAARAVMPRLPVSMIYNVFLVRDIIPYNARAYRFVSLRKKTVTEKLVRACHEQGIQLYVWTVDEEQEMRRFISMGVDGIYSNKPHILKDVVRAEGGMRYE